MNVMVNELARFQTGNINSPSYYPGLFTEVNEVRQEQVLFQGLFCIPYLRNDCKSLSCDQQVVGLRCPSDGNGPRCLVGGRSGTCKLVTSCKGEYSATGCPLATSLVTCCLGNDFGNINK